MHAQASGISEHEGQMQCHYACGHNKVSQVTFSLQMGIMHAQGVSWIGNKRHNVA